MQLRLIPTCQPLWAFSCITTFKNLLHSEKIHIMHTRGWRCRWTSGHRKARIWGRDESACSAEQQGKDYGERQGIYF